MIEVSLEFGPTNIPYSLTHRWTHTHTLTNAVYVHSVKIYDMWWPPRTEVFHNILVTIGITSRCVGEGALDYHYEN